MKEFPIHRSPTGTNLACSVMNPTFTFDYHR